MEPLVFGDYPKSMRSLVKERLPIFSCEESKLVKGSYDFIGINYYTSRYAKTASQPMPPRFSFDSQATQESIVFFLLLILFFFFLGHHI